MKIPLTRESFDFHHVSLLNSHPSQLRFLLGNMEKQYNIEMSIFSYS